ncbi:MAG: hypothetical protein LEGION0398_MBIBDBAK_00967 [Legionellaceae bacterium]
MIFAISEIANEISENFNEEWGFIGAIEQQITGYSDDIESTKETITKYDIKLKELTSTLLKPYDLIIQKKEDDIKKEFDELNSEKQSKIIFHLDKKIKEN